MLLGCSGFCVVAILVAWLAEMPVFFFSLDTSLPLSLLPLVLMLVL